MLWSPSTVTSHFHVVAQCRSHRQGAMCLPSLNFLNVLPVYLLMTYVFCWSQSHCGEVIFYFSFHRLKALLKGLSDLNDLLDLHILREHSRFCFAKYKLQKSVLVFKAFSQLSHHNENIHFFLLQVVFYCTSMSFQHFPQNFVLATFHS